MVEMWVARDLKEGMMASFEQSTEVSKLGSIVSCALESSLLSCVFRACCHITCLGIFSELENQQYQ